MNVFENHRNKESITCWVPLLQHSVSAASSPGRDRLPKWREAGVTDVVTLLRVDEMKPWLPKVCGTASMKWHHFPLSGRRLNSPNDVNIVKNIVSWIQFISTPHLPPARIVVHCAAGLHRTGFALYLMFRSIGLSPEDALMRIHQACPLTQQELKRHTRRSGCLVKRAEVFFGAAWANG